MSIGRNNDNLYSSSMLDLIDNIVEVVVNSYFYWVKDYQFKEDLMQEGYLKAYELLKTGNYDPNQSLRNYLYTGVRNAMTNLTYHNNKELHTSYDVYQDNLEVDVDFNKVVLNSTYTSYSLDLDLIIDACEKYDSRYIGNVLDYFRYQGLQVPNTSVRVEEPNPIKLKAIIVDIMWSL